ncbi:Fic domain protein, YP3572 type [hydrothermal vent metagenome]|uniref:Fic domain protein, YP3572 type n=1 Tax=hydrothermal vent metagenome TaxID=652676 RepID=A0A3B0UTD3_9ZZZZ
MNSSSTSNIMNKAKINIPDPDFGSNLSSIILDLEKLRTKELMGEIPPYIFFQLKNIFQILETLGSARIEGNNTTLAEYVEKIIEKKTKIDEKQKEVRNIDKAIQFIEKNTDENTSINRMYISELHKIITDGLTPPPAGEGSNYPGDLRPRNVQIASANHMPPDVSVLQEYFDEFIKFINAQYKEQYQLLVVALAHHRFAYIHPFDNGNGRIGRLLNYALLIKLGFKVKNGRIINPSSVFYTDREKYYNTLAKADSLEKDDVLAWSEYFLLGLKNEIEKIDSLLQNSYVKDKILLPTIDFALERENITEKEYKILKYLVKKDSVSMKSEELNILGIEDSVQKSRVMSRLKDKGMIKSIKLGGRIYTINFVNNYLLRGVIRSLEKEGFVSDFLNRN